MARIPETIIARRQSGPVARGATVEVRDRATDDVVAIFANEAGGGALAQPVDVGADGSLTFWREVESVIATVNPPGDEPYELPLGGELEAAGAGELDPFLPIGIAWALGTFAEIDDEVNTAVDVLHRVRSAAFQLLDDNGDPAGDPSPGVAFFVEDQWFQTRDGSVPGASWWFARREAFARVRWAGDDVPGGAGNFRDEGDPAFVGDEPPAMPNLVDCAAVVTAEGWLVPIGAGDAVTLTNDFGAENEPALQVNAYSGVPSGKPLIPLRTIVAVKVA